METYEEEDDTHFCIKCHLTVVGLENYVRHRQTGCRSREAKPEVAPEASSTPTTVTYPEILNADTFFSSLELQSSSKSNSAPRPRTLTDRERKSARTDDKNKRKTRRGQETDDSTTKEKLLNMPPVVSDLDDLMDHLGIPSLVGFPEIVTTTASKSTSAAIGKLTCSLSSTKTSSHENLAVSPLESMMNTSKGTNDRKRNDDPQRIEQDHGVWLGETILEDLDVSSENKEHAESVHEELEGYVEYDYQQDDETDEESAEDEIGDQESYSEDDDDDDREYPLHGHTGGKWKPSELLHDTTGRLNEDELEQDDDNQEHPPPSQTGGKWKPTDSSQVQRVAESSLPEVSGKEPGGSSLAQSSTHRQQPSPGHTRGKWIPGAGGDLGSGYWCDPCGRKLASRLLYNRHLLSDLHARRSIQEIDGDLQWPRGSASLLQRKSSSKRLRALANNKTKSKISVVDDNNRVTTRRTRKREKEVIWCEMCHARVRRPQMGKHLLSHYHCRVAGANPCDSPAARRFILANMANVVRQCPFQCATCRFYCNTEETFLLHWRSSLHSQKCHQIGENFKCTPCDFWCEGNDAMEAHLMSSTHRESVAMMSGSVPVVVRRQTSLVCNQCHQRFRYNLQLRLHARETGHDGNLTATDEYQSRIECDHCSEVFRSLVALQRHQLASHARLQRFGEDGIDGDVRQTSPYFCSFCTLNFATASEAVLHRRTLSHKEMVKVRKSSTNGAACLTRQCPHCGVEWTSLVHHKEHLLQQHPELCHRCPRCGMLFALPQDVTRHTRDVKCEKPIAEDVEDSTATVEGEWRCVQCPFVTESQAEFIFHDALHNGSVETIPEEASSSKAPLKYRCPMCEKIFSKVSLRNHIRSHTGERPFRCSSCSASFSRRSNLTLHQNECLTSSITSSSSTSTVWPAEVVPSRRRNHVCSECDTAFYTKHALRQHMLRHAGKNYKCGLPGCPTVLRTANELKSHRRLVHESPESDRLFRCDECSYAAKTSTQLRRHRRRHDDTAEYDNPGHLNCPYTGCNFITKVGSHLTRHIRLHTGTKPYKCRHCAYASNNLENLRKHVLSTTLHPGKTIYECETCHTNDAENPYSTNFAKELRAHLLEAHPQEFPRSSDASDHVARIFVADQ